VEKEEVNGGKYPAVLMRNKGLGHVHSDFFWDRQGVIPLRLFLKIDVAITKQKTKWGESEVEKRENQSRTKPFRERQQRG